MMHGSRAFTVLVFAEAAVGDIKLAALLGLLFGTRGVCLILFIAAISALAFVLLISGRNRSSPLRLPFVPFLFLGSVLWVFL